MSSNELAQRALFTFVDQESFLLTSRSIDKTGQVRLYWAHDPVVPTEEQCFGKTDNRIV